MLFYLYVEVRYAATIVLLHRKGAIHTGIRLEYDEAAAIDVLQCQC
jgi:hypothetical protein